MCRSRIFPYLGGRKTLAAEKGALRTFFICHLQLSIDKAAAGFELAERFRQFGRPSESVNPTEVEFFLFRQCRESRRQGFKRIATKIELAQVTKLVDGWREHLEMVVSQVQSRRLWRFPMEPGSVES